MTTYNPCHSLILVQPDKIETVTKSGFHIPEQAQRTLNSGTVMKCGPEVTDFKSGDKVVWDKHAEFKFGEDNDTTGEVDLVICVDAKSILMVKSQHSHPSL